MKRCASNLSAGLALACALMLMPVLASQAAAANCTTVKVKLVEYKIKLSTHTVDAGCIKFKVVNKGAEHHEVMLIDTDEPSGLVTDGHGTLLENKIPKADMLGETGHIEPNKHKTLKVHLRPGTYSLVCNVPIGMHSHDGGMDMDMSGEDGHEHGSTNNQSGSHFGKGMFTTITVE